MKKIILFYSMILIAFSCKSPNQNTNPIEEFQKNLVDNGTTGSNVTQVFKDGEIVDNIIANPEKAQNLLHKDFTCAWMGIIEQGGKIWNRENLFNDYFKNIIPEILPNGIVLKTVDAISDEKGVAIIQEGDAVGKNGEYDNKYVWIFKMKDGLIHSIREYNSDILVATQLYDYKLIIEEE